MTIVKETIAKLLKNILNTSYQELVANIPVITTKIFTIIAIILASRMLQRLASKSISNICKTKQIDRHTCLIIQKTVRYSITALGTVLALQNIGVEVSPLITAMGISGVALSFGMKDTISNTIAGVLIMAYRQFKVGDHIKIKDWEGKVIDINIRYTTIHTDDMTVFIPNSVLYSATFAIIHSQDK